jgi:polar amino acid transport system substrate-binding protein
MVRDRRVPSLEREVVTFLRLGADIAASVKLQFESGTARLGRLHLLPGRFMVIQQATGLAIAATR